MLDCKPALQFEDVKQGYINYVISETWEFEVAPKMKFAKLLALTVQ